jgi:hypothetical protein
MKDSVDLREILKNWPYDPENDARLAQGDDGREILQVRTPTGIEQYEMEGRPDGTRPHGMESALHYYEKRLQETRAAGKEPEFRLNSRDCAELFSEGTLYYLRYVRLFQLQDWTRTVRDTTRNLRVFDLVHRYAKREEDRQFLEKWRPYIVRIQVTACTMLEINQRQFGKALRITREAIEQLEALPQMEDETFTFELDRSLKALRELAEQIQKNRPLSEMERLEQQLRTAIERQEFERAAELRDRIRDLRRQSTC